MYLNVYHYFQRTQNHCDLYITHSLHITYYTCRDIFIYCVKNIAYMVMRTKMIYSQHPTEMLKKNICLILRLF